MLFECPLALLLIYAFGQETGDRSEGLPYPGVYSLEGNWCLPRASFVLWFGPGLWREPKKNIKTKPKKKRQILAKPLGRLLALGIECEPDSPGSL
jgi:hypothetical protein